MLCVWLAQERMVTFQSHQLQVGVDEYILKLLTLLLMFTAGFGYLGQVCFILLESYVSSVMLFGGV